MPYAKLGQQIIEGAYVFEFVITFGYRTDLFVWQALINKKVVLKVGWVTEKK